MKKINKILIVLVIFVLSACAKSASKITIPENATFNQQVMAQADGIRNAIDQQLPHAQSFKGQTCNLRAHFAPNGLLLDVRSEGGDPELCSAAISAARKANFPPFLHDDVYQVLQSVPLYFKV
ncbi:MULTISPECIES: cell envelope integrity protein TolA [Atlantibacter]|uniref:cell envelope integrity protein TolA n=1 Tax=Atlantibacter TaxID=1903434 RepID=UPI001933EBD2|nr:MULTISPECIES: cell envelope integrity protein TolA [Atlantibacter]MBL7634911.1 cell envelope integrity protein TolA [Atlantibacter hermannii]MBL7675057.1 cell envelope integrity protein TolA [Atlantibacter hermannii]MCZ7832938.1 cell envelope integrity protein TolA [Atlantibacter hermannii]